MLHGAQGMAQEAQEAQLLPTHQCQVMADAVCAPAHVAAEQLVILPVPLRN